MNNKVSQETIRIKELLYDLNAVLKKYKDITNMPGKDTILIINNYYANLNPTNADTTMAKLNAIDDFLIAFSK